MSLISQRDAPYLRLIRNAGKKISRQRNYDFIMIWIVYFVADKYLSKKYLSKVQSTFYKYPVFVLVLSVLVLVQCLVTSKKITQYVVIQKKRTINNWWKIIKKS